MKLFLKPLAFMLLALGGQAMHATTTGENPPENLKNSLQGSWTGVLRFHDFTSSAITPDATQTWLGGFHHLQIKNDSIWLFHYPCQFYYGGLFQTKADSIYPVNEPGMRSSLYLRRDTLIKTSLLENGVIVKEYFVKEIFDQQVIRQLLKDSINSDCLKGGLELIKYYYVDEKEQARFPVAMPDTFMLSEKKQLQTLIKTKKLSLPVNGKKRLFYVDEIKWTYLNLSGDNIYYPPNRAVKGKGIITLHPAEWWTGKLFHAHYEFGIKN